MATTITSYQVMLYLSTCHGWKLTHSQHNFLYQLYNRRKCQGIRICYHHDLMPSNTDFYTLKAVDDNMAISINASINSPHPCYFNSDAEQQHLLVSNQHSDVACYAASKCTHDHPIMFNHATKRATVETDTCGLIIHKYKV